VNVSQMMRQMMRELQGNDPKALELKVGQVVKGLVVQLLAENEAIINIGGHLLKAKLETPLQQGQVTMLQVQPNSTANQMLLKPVGSSIIPITEESMPELLKSAGLKDTPIHRQLLQLAHGQQVPITKESMKALMPIIQALPEGTNAAEWIKSGLAVHSKELPLSSETIKAMQQILYGKPIHQTMKQVSEQAAQLLQSLQGASSEAGTSPKLSTEAQQLLNKLIQMIQNVQSRGPLSDPSATINQSIKQTSNNEKGAALPPQPSGQASAEAQTQSVRPQSMSPEGPKLSQGLQTANLGAIPANTPSSTSEPAIRMQAGQESRGAAQQIPTEAKAADVKANPSQNQASSPIQSSEKRPEVPLSATSSTSNAAASAQSSALTSEPKGNWISQMLKFIGIDLENQLKQTLKQEQPNLKTALPLSTSIIAGDEAVPEPIKPQNQTLFDSLKQVLLQMQGEDMPPNLKESTQQLLQQITGQQLMLTPDRSGLFTHLTLVLPLQDGDSEQSASIHIQSRKGKKGEMDADNCRLLFDLNMKALGNTLIDVQVVNKMVNLQVHNDHPLIIQLVESGRAEIADALQGVGYQCGSVKCSAYPIPEDMKGAAAALGEASSESAAKHRIPSYKGVDLRI
jgi:hypothetical protein